MPTYTVALTEIIIILHIKVSSVFAVHCEDKQTVSQLCFLMVVKIQIEGNQLLPTPSE
jgi:hypothetical protein